MDEEENVGRQRGRAPHSPSPPLDVDDQDDRQQIRARSHARVPHSPTSPMDVDDQDNHQQNVAHDRGRVAHSPTPPIDVDQDDSHTSDLPDIVPDSPTRSSSLHAGTKRPHETDEEEDDSDKDEREVVVNKAPKLRTKSSRPKASDYDEFGKELVLTAANQYRALLASKGAFPNTSTELKLIKKAWKLVNAESGVKQSELTPSIVTIVSQFL